MLLFVTTIIAAFLFQHCSKAFTYPPAKTHDVNPERRAPPLLPSSPSLFNASTPTTNTYPIHCFREGDIKTSLAGCRPSLNFIRNHFTPYRTRQRFRMGRLPLLPAKPPYFIYGTGADCAITIKCMEPYRDDMFSWEQLRAAALAVAEDCEDSFGYGGWTLVGEGVGWNVKVLGFREGAGGVNGTVVGDEVDGMAGTGLVADS